METPKPKMQGTGINAENLQEFLESAANAADKGQSQFFTPREFGSLCAIPLPKTRKFICDLNAGAGDLLYASANATTKSLLGNDIDTCRAHRLETDKLIIQRITADLTLLYPLLKEVGWQCPLFVFNPPWDLHWYRDRLKALAGSSLPSVAEAFKALDPRLGKATIDSTVATMMVALDLMHPRGEGMLIANDDTLQRLILDSKAPHAPLAAHIWAHLILDGNPMTSEKQQTWDKDKTFRTGVIYFAASHLDGAQFTRHCADLAEFEAGVKEVANRYKYRRGGEVVSEYTIPDDIPDVWRAVGEEWKAQHEKVRTDYHIWLAPDGTIRTHLSLFDKESVKVDKREAERLFSLQGQRPMQLVVQASQRKDLLRAVNGGIWRVHPELPRLVDQAVHEYHACRAPLAKLSPVQSLGYLDEENSIRCTKDLMGNVPVSPLKAYYFEKDNPTKREFKLAFKAGQTYTLKTQTLHVERPKTKPDPLTGKDTEYLLVGQELAIYITGEGGHEFCFMDARLKTDGVKIGEQYQPITIDFTLQDLVGHFAIPEVPDVAKCKPQEFQLNLQRLDELELMMNEVTA
jgi:hypothetical protein